MSETAQQPATVEQPIGKPVTAEKSEGVAVTIARNSVWLLIDTVAALGVTLFCSMLVARRLGPDFMGQYNYILWFASVLRMLTEVAIPAAVRKFAAELMGRKDYVMLKTLVRNAMRLQAKIAVAGVLLGLAFVAVSFPPDQRGLGALACLTILPSLFMSIPTGAVQATEKLRYNVIASLIAMTVNLTGVVLSVYLELGLMGLIGSLLASRTLDCVLRLQMFRRLYAKLDGQPVENLDPALRKRVVPFAAQQIVLSALYALLFDRMEVFFLKALAPTREIAFFSISFTLVQYLLLFPQQMSGAAGASMMVKQGRSPGEAARIAATTTWFMMLIAAPVLFGMASLASPVMHLLYGAKYMAAIPVLVCLPLFGLALAVSQPAQYLLVASERQMFYIFWLVVSGLIDVGGNLLLIPGHGALGAAVAKGISQVVAGVGFLVFLVTQYKVALPVARMVKLLAACALMFLAVSSLRRWLLPLPTVVVGIPLGVAIFAVVTRLLRVLDAADGERLRQLARMLPGRVRGGYLGLIQFLVPRGAARPAAATSAPPPSV